MVIPPNNEIVLLDVPLEIDNKNQLTFSNANAQFQYFRFLEGARSYDKVTYVRKDKYIVVDDCYDNLIKFNYCMYQNENFSNKWYYAFIVGMEWLSPNSTKIYIKTDVWQTYQFDITFLSSFVEREHIAVADDTPGANLINEGLETGEYIENASTSINGLGICYALAIGRDPATISGTGASTSTYNGCFVNGIASGLWYYIGNMNKILDMIKIIDTAGYGEDIKAVYSIPTVAILGWDEDYTIQELDDRYQVWGFWVNNQWEGAGREFTLNSTPTTLNGYTPRNAKLKQYPFVYLGFTPSNGQQSIFRYEDFTSGTPSFKLVSEINPNPSVYFIPKNYKGSTGVNVSESVITNGYPSIAYKTDFFSNWIAQNSSIVNFNKERTEAEYMIGVGKNAINYMSGAIQTGVGIAGAGGAGFLGSTANILYDTWAGRQLTDMAIEEQMLQVEKQKMLPNTGNLGGSNATLLGYDYMNSDVFTRYTIKKQFAERIDLYFDMYGYKTNKLKIPNLNNRPNWNYIKTIGSNIIQSSGKSVPQEDLQELKAIFDNGVTLWHNTNTFLDYSQNNRT